MKNCTNCNKELAGNQTKYCSFRCKNTTLVRKRRKANKQKAINLLGGKCKLCGYNKCNDALEFHHINPKEKEFMLSKVWNSKTWEKLLPEIKKCVLLCANCHREVHNN